MHSIDTLRRHLRAPIWPLALALAVLAGCSPERPPRGEGPASSLPRSEPPSRTGGPSSTPAPATPADPRLAAGRRWTSPPPRTRHPHWEAWRRAAAQQLQALNLEGSYDGVPPEPLFAIPVLDIELEGDGRVRRVTVRRQPANVDARDTVQLVADAVRRAGPYPEVRHLPRPWTWTETFLVRNDRRFKPRTLEDL